MSEGWGYVDPDGVHNLERIVAVGLVPMAYHFYWGGAPDGKGPRHQAEFFVRQIRQAVDPMRVIPAIDVELSGSMEQRHYPRFGEVREFLQRLEALLPGKRVCIYSGYYWRGNMGNPRVEDLNLRRRPIIWDAHYFHSADAPAASFEQYRRRIPNDYFEEPAFGGARADIVQFSDRVRFSEYVGDADLADTDLAGLREWARAA
jgi:GH25 family lysozyme M1 (1,4-beta-N-acetylmuramidase)